MKPKRWNNKEGVYSTQIRNVGWGWADATSGIIQTTPEMNAELNGCMTAAAWEKVQDCVITFLSSGYVTPATHLDPPESEDYRRVWKVLVNGTKMSKATAERLFDHFSDAIQNVELEIEE